MLILSLVGLACWTRSFDGWLHGVGGVVGGVGDGIMGSLLLIV